MTTFATTILHSASLLALSFQYLKAANLEFAAGELLDEVTTASAMVKHVL